MNNALAFLLQGLYFTEIKLKEEFTSYCRKITSPKIRNEIENYIQNAGNKISKLERVFNYLMKEPVTRPTTVIGELVNETRLMLASTPSTHLRDIVTVGCVQSIVGYKIANYRSAYMFAAELELDTATDLLQQILEWEMNTGKALSALAIEEFNNIQLTQQN